MDIEGMREMVKRGETGWCVCGGGGGGGVTGVCAFDRTYPPPTPPDTYTLFCAPAAVDYNDNRESLSLETSLLGI